MIQCYLTDVQINLNSMEHADCHIFQQYAEALERENQAKDKEQLALYHHIHSLQQELAHMEHYHLTNTQLHQQLITLRQQLHDQQPIINSLHDIKKALQEKTQAVQRLQHLLYQKDNAIQRLEQELQEMDERACKLRECLQAQQYLTAQLREDNSSLIRTVRQLELQVKQSRVQNQYRHTPQPQLAQQELLLLLEKYQILRNECERQETRQEELQQELEQCRFTVEAKDNEIQAKNIRIRQLENKLLYLMKKKTTLYSCKSSALLSQVHTEPTTKIPINKETDFNNDEPSLLMKQNDSFIQNQVRSEYNQKSFMSQVELQTKRKSSSKLQLRNEFLKKQKQSLLHQLEI